MDDRLKAARARVRVRIEVERDNGFAAAYLAFRLARALSQRGYGVHVSLVGGDEREAEARRRAMRAV
jgi:hypothetical protein